MTTPEDNIEQLRQRAERGDAEALRKLIYDAYKRKDWLEAAHLNKKLLNLTGDVEAYIGPAQRL